MNICNRIMVICVYNASADGNWESRGPYGMGVCLCMRESKGIVSLLQVNVLTSNPFVMTQKYQFIFSDKL